MIRNIIILVLSVALLACLYSGVFRMVTADAEKAMTAELPELEWLRREYALSDEQFAEIRSRHMAHDVICQKLCYDLVIAQKKLDTAIANSPEMSSEVQMALSEWTAQRKICREAAISHMYEISSVLAPEQGADYRRRVYENLIIPGKMPHVDANGEFEKHLIEHAAPSAEKHDSVE